MTIRHPSMTLMRRRKTRQAGRRDEGRDHRRELYPYGEPKAGHAALGQGVQLLGLVGFGALTDPGSRRRAPRF